MRLFNGLNLWTDSVDSVVADILDTPVGDDAWIGSSSELDSASSVSSAAAASSTAAVEAIGTKYSQCGLAK